MKKHTLLLSLLVVLGFTSTSFAAENIENEFDSLGGNTALLDKAKAINPEVTTSIVQSRTVNLINRWEVAPEVSGTFGGDTYSRTTSIGMNVNYHINYNWSLGVKYNYSFNRLTDEGNNLVNKAKEDHAANPETSQSPVPSLDYPLSEAMAYINWYPIYGKMKWLNQGVAHFDIYGILGGGQVKLKSGDSDSWTAGLGMGIWASPKVSTRFEVRYQTYKAQYYSGPVDLDLAIASMQVGWLL